MRTVGGQIGQVSETLLDKISSNGQVANLVMGLVGKIIWITAQAGKPMSGLQFGEVRENLGDFTFTMKMSYVNLGASIGLMPVRSDVMTYIGAKSEHMAKAVAACPALLKTMTDLVKAIDGYCRHKGIQFKDWRVEKAFFTRDNTAVIKTAKANKGRWE